MNAAQATTILSQLTTIEAQLNELKQQVREMAARNGEETHTFADLKGIWAGQGNFSEEEIDACLYKLTPEWIDDIATLPKRDDVEERPA